MLFRIALTVLVVIAVGLVGWRISVADNSAPHSDTAAPAPTGSDYYMRDATIYQINPQGQLTYRAQLGKTLHYPDDSARLRDIRVHYQAGTGATWVLEAARGRIPAGSSDLHLSGGVTLQTTKPNAKNMVVHTDNVWVHTKTDVIETRAHVIARAPERTIDADGLRINLVTNQFKLLDNVQVRYAP